METTENIKSASGTIKNIIIAAACVAIVGLGYAAFDQYSKNKDLEQQVHTLDKYNSEALNGFAKIEHNLMSIREREGTIVSDLNAEGMQEENSQQRIANEIKAIESLIDENKALISQLKLTVGDKDKQIGQFSTSIKQLEGRIKKYREEADKLQASLKYANAKGDSLGQEVAKRDFDIDVKTQVIDVQANHLNAMTTEIRKMDFEKREAFFVVGTFDDLKERNVLERQGGVLGLGSTKVLKENFDRDQFIKIDKQNFETIPVFSKNAEIVSNHDKDSYELVLGKGDMVEYIKILDPDKFWENTRYLVVVTRGQSIQEL